MTISRLFVYLQRPDTGAWVTVGRYGFDHDSQVGTFSYAPSYADAGLTWSLDPVNLPFISGPVWRAERYGGLHDALRDAAPDAWGKSLLQREHHVPDGTAEFRYLALSSNGQRWGALAVGGSSRPPRATISSPRLPQLEAVTRELVAIYQHEAPIDALLRRRLVSTPSLGGARPKVTVQDGHSDWIVKPYLPSDVVDMPRLEHFSQQWGRASGLDFAATIHQSFGDNSVVRVLRFDREAGRRVMALSAASLLQTQTPSVGYGQDRWSYPRLAEQLKLIGAPPEDLIELFGRMVFNAVAGNDDDHPRNHAVLYRYAQSRWRLSPAFDVVPNPIDHVPETLCMQLCLGRFDIARETVLADAARFGFASAEVAGSYLDLLLLRIERGFETTAPLLGADLVDLVGRRLQTNLRLLRASGA